MSVVRLVAVLGHRMDHCNAVLGNDDPADGFALVAELARHRGDCMMSRNGFLGSCWDLA